MEDVISIHKALTGLDDLLDNNYQATGKFQSTRPSRASTEIPIRGFTIGKDFNPQGPHGPRPNRYRLNLPDIQISIHKALTGLDAHTIFFNTIEDHFNPQGPHGPRRSYAKTISEFITISIHKALTGLDETKFLRGNGYVLISIHKALTGLDSDIRSQIPSA